ncbi:DUF6452 family protein [Winogradskyella sp.]|uniref:DUF6452 family protein n=1 Tax=Winogradskyella sp. TaxID=1883156 RepID=UPI002605FC8C|nr:DUF6452 family protein [Winogradskyella sp.]
MNSKTITKCTFLIIVFSAIIITLFACERDDICAETTPTTPRLFIEFYDATSPEDLRSVPRLTAYGEGLITDSDGNPIEPTEVTDGILELSDGTFIFDINRNAIDLPLRIDDGLNEERVRTRFILERNTNLRLDESGTSNVDIIEISYVPQFEYVSRACGYKSIFNAIDVTVDNDGDNWISSIEIDVQNLENENTTHVRIFH